MSWLFTRSLLPLVALAAGLSLLLNVALLVPALYTLQVFDRVFASRSVETLAMLAALVAVAIGFAHAMDVLRARALARAAEQLATRLAPPALRRMLEQRAQMQAHVQTQVQAQTQGSPHAAVQGDAAPELLQELGTLRRFCTQGLVTLLDAPWLVLHVAVIALLHPLLGAATAAGTLLLVALGGLTELLTRQPAETHQAQSRAAQRQAQQLLRRAETVVGMGMARAAVAAWQDLDDQARTGQARLTERSQRLAAWARTVQQAVQAAVLTLGAWLVVAQDASPGIMVAATLLLGRALQPAAQLIGGWQRVVHTRAAWRRLQTDAGSTRAADTGVALPAPRGALQVERVVFGGSAKRAALLKGVSLCVPAGTQVGIVGASGSGKSTLLRLLLGLWLPQGGTVRLDGADIAGWPREALGPFVGYLSQDVELFPGTVAQNIARLGPIDGAIHGAAVTAAAQLAQAHELILRLPQGYDTPVGEGGTALSGGQRQRIGLARALYGTPRLVVLDEPNAHLDAEGDAALAAALAALRAQGSTVIVATHRRSVLAEMDQVAVLHEGQLQLLHPLAFESGADRADRANVPAVTQATSPALSTPSQPARHLRAVAGGAPAQAQAQAQAQVHAQTHAQTA